MEVLERFKDKLSKSFDADIYEITSIKENDYVIYAVVEMIDKNAPIIPDICDLVIEKNNPNIIKLYNPFMQLINPNQKYKNMKTIWKKK